MLLHLFLAATLLCESAFAADRSNPPSDGGDQSRHAQEIATFQNSLNEPLSSAEEQSFWIITPAAATQMTQFLHLCNCLEQEFFLRPPLKKLGPEK